MTALNEGRGDFFAVAKSLALFVNALHNSDQQFVALNNDLATFTNSFTNSDQELATALKDINTLLTTARKFIDDNGSVLSKDINNLAEVTNAILQPEPRNGLETVLHVYPNLSANFQNIYHPTHGALVSAPTVASFANPMQFLCSAIQAGSRLGYQDSAELCAEYLAPILDAIKFNFRRSASTSSRRPRRCRSTSPTPSRGCSRRPAGRTPRCPASGRGTRCSRTATPRSCRGGPGSASPTGSWRPACRVSTCRSPPTC